MPAANTASHPFPFQHKEAANDPCPVPFARPRLYARARRVRDPCHIGPGPRSGIVDAVGSAAPVDTRSEEHTSELQSLMRISYAVFCLKKKKANIKSKIYHLITVPVTIHLTTNTSPTSTLITNS